jgi:hypothetical protein
MTEVLSSPEMAARLARAIASDICLYNEERIERAIEKDSLFEELREEIEKGRAMYKQRVTNEIYVAFNFYDRALVDIIFKLKGEQVASPIWH